MLKEIFESTGEGERREHGSWLKGKWKCQLTLGCRCVTTKLDLLWARELTNYLDIKKVDYLQRS